MSEIKEAINAYLNIAFKRCSLYDLLGIAFLYPTQEVIAELKEKENLDLIEEIKEIYSVMPSFAETLDSFKKGIYSIAEIPEMQVEYARLFIGPFKLPSPPYESVYRVESKGLLMGDSTIDVKKIYQEEGLGVSSDVHDLPDHILVELEFMAHLSEQESISWEKDIEKAKHYLAKQDGFLTGHLTQWIPQFTKAVYDNSGLEFYRSLARFTGSFIALDHDYVRALINSVKTFEGDKTWQ